MSGKASLSQRERESVVRPWLEKVGVVGIKHVGDGSGPPDFAGRYDDECVAIEIMQLFPSHGWSVRMERGLAFRLRKLIADVYEERTDGPWWNVTCEYDPSQPFPSSKSTEWKEAARLALRTPGLGGTFPLMPRGQQKGYGLELILRPTNRSGAFGHLPEHEPDLVSPSRGFLIVEDLISALPRVIEKKTLKFHDRTRYRSCKQWWLVLDDNTLKAPSSVLANREKAAVSSRVAECPEIGLWSKVVLYSRFQPTPPPAPAPGWFWPLWECAAHSPLPLSP